MNKAVEPKKKTALTVALVITIVVVIASCLLYSGMFGLLLLSATPQMMPIRWTMMCTTPFVIFGLIGASAYAYKKQIQKLLYFIPIALIVYMFVIAIFFIRLNPDQ